MWNAKRHFETNHHWLLERSEEERKEIYFLNSSTSKRVNQIKFLKFLKRPTNVTSASFGIAPSVAQHGKALGEGKLIKETLLKCAPLLFQDVQNKGGIKHISDLPVSRNTIKDKR